MKTVGVLGLGEAGSLLARDLVRGGAAVRGWDPDLHGDLSEIPVAASLAAAVTGADVVISVNGASVAAEVARAALPPLGMRVGTFMAGSGAEEPAAFYRGFGTPVGFVGALPGEANARKLTRSVEAARAVGIEDRLRSDIIETLAEADVTTRIAREKAVGAYR